MLVLAMLVDVPAVTVIVQASGLAKAYHQQTRTVYNMVAGNSVCLALCCLADLTSQHVSNCCNYQHFVS